MTTSCFCCGAVFIRDLELLHPQIRQLMWKGKVLSSPSHHTSEWGGPFYARRKARYNQMKEKRSGISQPGKSQKRTCWRPLTGGPGNLRGIKLQCTVQRNQSWTWKHAAPWSMAPVPCVQEAVVRQLKHSPMHSVMTAVGNCYVSVPFLSLQE